MYIHAGVIYVCMGVMNYYRTKVRNNELEKEIVKLKKSYEELKLLKETLENQNVTVQENLTDTQKEANLYKVRKSESLVLVQSYTKYLRHWY